MGVNYICSFMLGEFLQYNGKWNVKQEFIVVVCSFLVKFIFSSSVQMFKWSYQTPGSVLLSFSNVVNFQLFFATSTAFPFDFHVNALRVGNRCYSSVWLIGARMSWIFSEFLYLCCKIPIFQFCFDACEWNQINTRPQHICNYFFPPWNHSLFMSNDASSCGMSFTTEISSWPTYGHSW